MKSLTGKIILLAVATAVLTGIPLGIASVLFMNDTSDHQIRILERNLREDFDRHIKSATQQAVSLLQGLVDQRDQKKITDAEARRLGVELLRNLRYDGQGYFWADTYEGTNVVLLGSSTEGTNRWEAQDVRGNFFIQMIHQEGLKSGGGFVDYWFPRPGRTEPAPKRGYALAFEPFRWVLGTGNYVDDIESALAGYTNQSRSILLTSITVILGILILGTCLALVLAFWAGERVGKPLKDLNRALENLSRGDADLTKPLAVETKDEVGRLAQSFNTFVGNLRQLQLHVRQSLDSLVPAGPDGVHLRPPLTSPVEEIGNSFQNFQRILDDRTDQLLAAQADLIKSTQLAVLEPIVMGISHHLNTPLGNGILALSLLSRSLEAPDRPPPTEEQKTALALAGRSLEISTRLINRFKQVASLHLDLEENTFEALSLVRHMVTMVRSEHPEAVFLDFLSPGPIYLKGSALAFAEVQRNLLDNAARFGKNPQNSAVVRVETEVIDGLLEIRVSDLGPGLEPKMAQKIFEPFFTTDLAHSTGLGLTLVDNVVTALFKGTINVTTAPGEGLTMVCRYPISGNLSGAVDRLGPAV